jgi:hypothetical protein
VNCIPVVGELNDQGVMKINLFGHRFVGLVCVGFLVWEYDDAPGPDWLTGTCRISGVV